MVDVKLAGKNQQETVSSAIAIEWRRVGSNAPSQFLQLKLHGRFVSPFYVVPEMLSLEVGEGREIQRANIIVKPGLIANDMRHARVEVDNSDGSLNGSFGMTTATEGLLSVVMDPKKMFDGLNREVIRLVAYKDEEYVGETPIGVAIRIDGNVHADVRQLIVAVGKQQPSVTKSLTLSSEDGKPFRMEALYSDVSWLNASESNSGGTVGLEYQIECRITDEGDSQIGYLFATTDGSKGRHTLRIPILRSVLR